MVPHKTAPDDVPARQVNIILRNLRGEQFRRAQNVQGNTVSFSLLSSYTHNQPTLPLDLIYPTRATEPSPASVPGPSPPKSWQFPSSPSKLLTKLDSDIGPIAVNTPAWRERALSLFFSPNNAHASPSHDARSRLIPPLTVLCLQRLRAACPGTDLADVVPFIPLHLRRTLVRHTAIRAPLSQTELDVLCGGAAHVDTELIVVGPHATLRACALRRDDRDRSGPYGDGDADTSWDAVRVDDGDSAVLRSLAVLSSPLSAATMLAFPPTITRLVLVNIPHRIPLRRLPTICPFVVLLDLSYNAWLNTPEALILEEIEWGKLRRLEMLGLRACRVTPKLPIEVNRGRWEDVKIVR